MTSYDSSGVQAKKLPRNKELCVAMYGYVGMAMYVHVWLCRDMYGYVWIYMVM